MFENHDGLLAAAGSPWSPMAVDSQRRPPPTLSLHFLKYHIPAFIYLCLHIGFTAAAILRDSKIRDEGFVHLTPVDHDGELEQTSSVGHDAQLTDTQIPMHDVKIPTNVLRATIEISVLSSGFTTVGIYSYA
ncbi:hypothetical protein B0H13DRAFT_1870456 [Mycena leptocephala]|nr:hypothetical protein B0H13DRAFT_1870456 [Mycena leptocephala]